MARSKLEFIVFTTRDMRTQNPSVKGSSFTCGNTKTAHGKSRASSVTTTTPQPSNGGLCALRGFNVAAESNWKEDASEKQAHACKPRKDGAPVIFQEVVHSI